MNATPLYIFDLDGTLANLKHRRHHVEKPLCTECQIVKLQDKPLDPKCTGCKTGWKPNWNAFHAKCVNDTPIQPVINTLQNLRAAGAEVWIFSGRNNTVRTETEDWLDTFVPNDIGGFVLRMRSANDRRMDEIIKEEWLHAMSPEDRARLIMTFDDRQRVVDMWRRNGVVCAQVAPGDF